MWAITMSEAAKLPSSDQETPAAYLARLPKSRLILASHVWCCFDVALWLDILVTAERATRGQIEFGTLWLEGEGERGVDAHDGQE